MTPDKVEAALGVLRDATEWRPRKNWIIGWILERRESTYFAGSFVRFAKDPGGSVMYFLTLKSAQKAADALNMESDP